MASGTAYLVFALPVVFTVVFGSVVLITALDELDREISMWPDDGASSHSSDISTASIEQAYAGSSTSKIQIHTGDPLHGCAYPEAIIRNSPGDLFSVGIGESKCLGDKPLSIRGVVVTGGVL